MQSERTPRYAAALERLKERGLVVIGFVKAVVDMVRHPFYFPASTVLLVVSGIMIGSLALLSDLVVRSRDGV